MPRSKLPPKPGPRKPLWGGPYEDGITFSLLSRFLVCPHRFWLKTVLGLTDEDEFNHSIEYGNLWHVAEEWHGRGKPYELGLRKYRDQLLERYPDNEEAIDKWYSICCHQFAIYLRYLKTIPGVHKYKSIADERTFRVPYMLPSGRTIILRGKFDRIFYTKAPNTNIIYCQENKSKGEIDVEGIQKTVAENLQTMLYQVALRKALVRETQYSTTRKTTGNPYVTGVKYKIVLGEGGGTSSITLPNNNKSWKIAGVLYNIVRRPLADRFAIKQREGRTIKLPNGTTTKKGAETPKQFYARVAKLIEQDPSYYFVRMLVQLDEQDMESFCQRTFHPIMERLCDWWDYISKDPFNPWRDCVSPHFQAPWGVYNGMYGGFRGDYFEYLTSNARDTSGLTKAKTLFPELA